jgi:hypothetical protein
MTTPNTPSNSFAWGTSSVVLLIYVVAIVGSGTYMLTRRDA